MVRKEVNYRPAVDLISMVLDRVPMLDRLHADFSRISAWLTAQEKMAERLHSALAERPDVAVFSSLEFRDKQRKFALDHLVLGLPGAVIIDARSATGSLYVDSEGQWSRREGEHGRRMGFPLTQMEEAQAKASSLLSGILREALPTPKEAAKRESLANYRADGYVAISPDAELHNWPYRNLGALVRHQDEVVRAIERRFEVHERQFLARFTQFLRREQKPPPALKPNELAKAADLLLARDRAPTPLRMVANAILEHSRSIPQGVQTAVRRIRDEEQGNPNLDTLTNDTLCMLQFCQHCNATDLHIEGEDGAWSFVCSNCNNESLVLPVCAECGGNGTLTRIKKTFFIRCNACGKERVFFFNR